MSGVSRLLLVFRAMIATAGLLLLMPDRIGWLGRLPWVTEHGNTIYCFLVVT